MHSINKESNKKKIKSESAFLQHNFCSLDPIKPIHFRILILDCAFFREARSSIYIALSTIIWEGRDKFGCWFEPALLFFLVITVHNNKSKLFREKKARLFLFLPLSYYLTTKKKIVASEITNLNNQLVQQQIELECTFSDFIFDYSISFLSLAATTTLRWGCICIPDSKIRESIFFQCDKL